MPPGYHRAPVWAPWVTGCSCFTMLCWFLLNKNVNHPQADTCLLSLAPTSHSLCLSSRLPRSMELSAPCCMAAPTSCLFHTWQCTHVNTPLPIHHTLLSFPAVSMDSWLVFISCLPAVNTGEQRALEILILFPLDTHSGGISGSYGSSIFNFLRNFNIFHGGFTNLHSS